MRVQTLALILLFLAGNAFASKSSLILDCAGKSENWFARLQIDAVGSVKLYGEVDHTKFHCDLDITEFSYPKTTESNSLMMRLRVRSCFDANSQSYKNKYLLPVMSLISQPKEKGATTGALQWVTYLAPNECSMSHFSRYEVEQAAEKWAKHAWP